MTNMHEEPMFGVSVNIKISYFMQTIHIPYYYTFFRRISGFLTILTLKTHHVWLYLLIIIKLKKKPSLVSVQRR